MLRTVWLLAGASVALAQQYTISTVAGGAPPSTPATATSTLHRPAQPRHPGFLRESLLQQFHNCVFKLNSSGVVDAGGGQLAAGFLGRWRPGHRRPVELASGPGLGCLRATSTSRIPAITACAWCLPPASSPRSRAPASSARTSSPARSTTAARPPRRCCTIPWAWRSISPATCTSPTPAITSSARSPPTATSPPSRAMAIRPIGGDPTTTARSPFLPSPATVGRDAQPRRCGARFQRQYLYRRYGQWPRARNRLAATSAPSPAAPPSGTPGMAPPPPAPTC